MNQNKSNNSSSPSKEGDAIRVKVQSLLDKAAKERQTSLQDAIITLEEAAQLIPNLHDEEQTLKQTVRNVTENKINLEVRYFSKRGNIYYEIGNYQDAELNYTEVKKRIPSNCKALKALGDALRKQGKYQEAIARYDDGLDVYDDETSPNPKDKAALLNSKGLALEEYNKQFDEAIKCFKMALEIAPENPLYHCNKGRALYAKNPKDLSSSDAFQEAYNLTLKDNLKVEGLTKTNISFINKTLGRFINLLQELKQIVLTRDDSVIADREQIYVKETVEGLSELKDVSGQQIVDTKKRLKKLFTNPNLTEFYDGFLYTLRQSYSTAVIVDSGKFSIGAGDPAVSGLKGLVSMIPLVGSAVSDGIEQVEKFIKTPQVTNAAANVAKFAKDDKELKAIAQDAVVVIITERQKKIESLKDEDTKTLSVWTARFKKLFDKFKQSEDCIYDSRVKTTMQKLGYQTAVDLISKFIANGNVYRGKKAIDLLPYPEVKTERLMNAGLDLLDKGVEEGLEKQKFTPAEDNSVKPIVAEKEIKKMAKPATTEGPEDNSVKPIVPEKDIKIMTSTTTTGEDKINSPTKRPHGCGCKVF